KPGRAAQRNMPGRKLCQRGELTRVAVSLWMLGLIRVSRASARAGTAAGSPFATTAASLQAPLLGELILISRAATPALSAMNTRQMQSRSMASLGPESGQLATIARNPAAGGRVLQGSDNRALVARHNRPMPVIRPSCRAVGTPAHGSAHPTRAPDRRS